MKLSQIRKFKSDSHHFSDTRWIIKFGQNILLRVCLTIKHKMNKIGKAGNAWVWVIVAVAAVFILGIVKIPNLNLGQADADNALQTYAADAAYSTQNAFSTASVSGTAYYAEKNGIFQTSAPKLERGTEYTYWVSSATEYVDPLTFKASGSNNIVNKKAYTAGAITITGYDVVYACNVNDAIDGTDCNTTLGAGKEAKIDVKYLGSGKIANLPFGGVMVVEYNASIPTQTCSGDGIVGLNSKYQVTYSDSATSYTHKIYEVSPGFDISKNAVLGTGVTNVIRCEFVAGSTGAAPGPWKVTFIPANYYIGNDGKLYLDVEQKMNSATIRTGIAEASLTKTFYSK